MKNKNIIILVVLISMIIITITIYYQTKKSLPKKLTINQAITENIFYPCFNENSTIYLSDQGIILYKYDFLKNQKSKLLEDEILGVLNAVCSNDLSKIIFYNNYPENQIISYNLTDKKYKILNKNIRQFIFDNNSNDIYYIYSDRLRNIYTLNKSKSDGSDWKKLIDLPESSIDYQMQTINNNIFLISKDIYKYDTQSNKLDKLLNLKISDNVIISKDGDLIVYNEFDKNTSIYNIKTNKSTELSTSFNLKQAIFSENGEYIYYLKDLENLVQLDTKSLKQKTISLDNSNINYTNLLDDNISNLFISKDDLVLYFTHNYRLYFIKLK